MGQGRVLVHYGPTVALFDVSMSSIASVSGDGIQEGISRGPF